MRYIVSHLVVILHGKESLVNCPYRTELDQQAMDGIREAAFNYWDVSFLYGV